MDAAEEPFLLSELLKGHQRGFVDMETGNIVRNLIGEVERLRRGATLTLTFSFVPENTQDGDAVKIAIDHTHKLPKEPAVPTLYFVADDKRPTRRSPRQPLTPAEGNTPIFPPTEVRD